MLADRFYGQSKALPSFRLQPLKLTELPPGVERLIDFGYPALRRCPLPGLANIMKLNLNFRAGFLGLSPPQAQSTRRQASQVVTTVTLLYRRLFASRLPFFACKLL